MIKYRVLLKVKGMLLPRLFFGVIGDEAGFKVDRFGNRVGEPRLFITKKNGVAIDVPLDGTFVRYSRRRQEVVQKDQKKESGGVVNHEAS